MDTIGLLLDKYYFTALAVGFVSTLYLAAYVQRKRSGLDKIPTMGPSGTLTSWLGSWYTFKHGHQIVQEGYEKHRIFKISNLFSWMVLINGPEQLEDMRTAGDDQISSHAALKEFLQPKYTIGPGIESSRYHNKAVRGPMSRNIGARLPDLLDETDKTFKELLTKADNDWVSLTTFESAVHIVSRVSTRFFVGPELSANSNYRAIMQGFTEHVNKTRAVLGILPEFLKATVSHYFFDSPSKVNEIEDYLRPLIEEKMEKKGPKHASDTESDNNMINWLLDTAPESHRTIRDITTRMILLHMGAIFSTSALLTHVLYNIATYPSYVEPLREEISAAVHEEGWNKTTLDKMRRLDSFLKESQRLHASEAILSGRKVVRDFTFSDGTFIPKGTSIAVTSRAINLDERYFPNPQEFQGFRFVEKDPLKHQLTALTSECIIFGLGRDACPGRFFAAAEVKLIVARLLLEYDIRFTNQESGRPKSGWFIGLFVAPNRDAKISIRKRA